MNRDLYRYTFDAHVPMDDIDAAMALAIVASESLHGEAQVRLDAGHFFDPEGRACVIDAGTPVGQDINRLFVGFVMREFGEDAFTVEPVFRDTMSTANGRPAAVLVH